MNRNIHIGLPIGTASILLIFLTLSLTSFAVLSLETSVADMNLTSKSADYTQNYYAAFHEAQGFLADMDSKLSSLYYESADYNDYMRKAGFFLVSALLLCTSCTKIKQAFNSVTANAETMEEETANNQAGQRFINVNFCSADSMVVLSADIPLANEGSLTDSVFEALINVGEDRIG